MIRNKRRFNIKLTDFIPAISGLIGKIALVSSFAVVWAQELGINNTNFIFENVRIETLIGSIITLLAALLYPHVSPAGSLAPLVVLIPAMAAFGVHPLILGISVGIIGIIAVKTGLFTKLVDLSGFVSKTSLTLAFGVAGIVLSAKELILFFGKDYIVLISLILILSIAYIAIYRYKKTWIIIPIACIVSFIIPAVFGIHIDISFTNTSINLNPSYWWNDMWGIGYGFKLFTILKTLPFAIFVIFLWTIDTVSIKTLQETCCAKDEIQEKLDIESSFIIISIRNFIGAFIGGAQTSSLWRSFLIPLYLVKRPIQGAAILLGVFGIITSITQLPIHLMLYPPLIWSVLLFGIFVPFTVAALLNIKRAEKLKTKLVVIIISLLGILITPIITWIASIIYEKAIEGRNSK